MRLYPISLKYTLELVPLGQSFFWKCKILIFWLFLFLKRHLQIPSRSPWYFRLALNSTPFYFYLTDEIDVQSLVGVVLRGEYSMLLKKEPVVIVDLGSNIGTSILYYRLLYPDASIYGFEANPRIFSILQMNVSQFSKVTTFNYAVTDYSGQIDLFINKRKSSASSIIKSEERSDVVEVTSIDLNKVKQIVGRDIDLLKFDIEGAEERVFSDTRLMGIRNLIGEVHLGLMKVSERVFLSNFKKYRVDVERREKNYFILRAFTHEKA